VDIPETRYARTVDGVSIAYQVLGEGPFDLVYVPGWTSNVEAVWELPLHGPFLRALASLSRLILFDRRGAGISDRPPNDESLAIEYGVDDIRAVMDAVGSERAALLGFEDGGILSAVFAASYPERVQALILFAAYARYRKAPDYPWGSSEDQILELMQHIQQEWGTEGFWRWQFATAAPSKMDDEAFLRAFARYFRQCASPSAMLATERATQQVDARSILPSIQAPTLVMHREGDLGEPLEQSRWISEQIPGAKMLVLPGDDHILYIGDSERVVDEIEAFVSGIREEESEYDRLLATLLFTDIVGSTERASSMGDRAWHELLERHHATVRAMLGRYRGREISTAGDGFLATFDGPARAIKCARAIAEAVRPLGLEIRAGLHTGEIELVGDDVRGIAVHIGARVSALAGASQVLVSQTVKDLVAGSGLTFEDAGEHDLKGVPDRWHLYRVVG
jgi:pimeloyl-ACP methyl ester carboxylesterase